MNKIEPEEADDTNESTDDNSKLEEIENVAELDIVDNLHKLDKPKQESAVDYLIKGMEQNDVAVKLQNIIKQLSSIYKDVSTNDLDPEEASSSETNFRALGTALQRYAGDRALQVLRNRDTALNLVQQLSKCVHLVTNLAKVLDIDFEGSKIEPTIDFSKWSYERLNRLATHIVVQVERIINDNAFNIEKIQRLNSTLNEINIKEVKVDEKNKNDVSIYEGKIQTLNLSVKRLTSLLVSHVDQQSWAVVKIDSTTKQPIRYYYEEDGIIKSAKRFEKAIINSLKLAKSIRWNVMSHVQENAKRNEMRTIRDNIVIMQISLFTVDFTSEYEDE
jgi:hypothetical protein